MISMSHQNAPAEQICNECLLGVFLLKRERPGKETLTKLPEDADFQF